MRKEKIPILKIRPKEKVCEPLCYMDDGFAIPLRNISRSLRACARCTNAMVIKLLFDEGTNYERYKLSEVFANKMNALAAPLVGSHIKRFSLFPFEYILSVLTIASDSLRNNQQYVCLCLHAIPFYARKLSYRNENFRKYKPN